MCTRDTPDRARRFGRDHDFDSTVCVMAPTAGILLTGGRSRRMGVDKAVARRRRRDAGRAGRSPPGRGVQPGGRGGRRRQRARRASGSRRPGAGPAGGAGRRRHVAAATGAITGPRCPARGRPSRASTSRCSRWLRDRPGEPTVVPAGRRPAPAGVRALRRRRPARGREPRRRGRPRAPRAASTWSTTTWSRRPNGAVVTAPDDVPRRRHARPTPTVRHRGSRG